MKKTDAGPARGIREECSVKKKNTAKTRREAMNGAVKAEARTPQPEARPAEKRVPPPFGVPDEAVCRESGWTR